MRSITPPTPRSRFARGLGYALLVALGIGGVFTLGCVPQDVPGEAVGSFLFSGPLGETSCGPGLPVNSEIEFRVEMRRDGDMAIWRRPGSPIVYGFVDEDEVWQFDVNVAIPAYDVDPVSGRGPCVFEQLEHIEVRAVGDDDEVDEGVEYIGSSEVVIRPSAGSDCSPSLVVYGGPFDTLPCAVDYRFESESLDPLFND